MASQRRRNFEHFQQGLIFYSPSRLAKLRGIFLRRLPVAISTDVFDSGRETKGRSSLRRCILSRLVSAAAAANKEVSRHRSFLTDTFSRRRVFFMFLIALFFI